MPIEFARESPVSAGWPENDERARRKPESAVGAAAYLGRRRMRSAATGKTYDYRPRPTVKKDGSKRADNHRRSKPLYRAIMLPKHADKRFLNSGALWSAAESAELVFDRQTKTWRFRRGAVLARRLIVAMPKEITLRENIRLLRRFVKRNLTDKGVAAEIAIHESDDPETGNIHAHILFTSRRIYGDRFADERATDLAPKHCAGGFVVETSRWPERWAEAQNRFFVDFGIPLKVDPISLVSRVHEGPARRNTDSNKVALNAQLAAQDAELLRDPAQLLRRVSERTAVFDVGYLRRLLAKAGITGMEARRIIQETLLLPEIVAVDPPAQSSAPGKKGRGDRMAARRFTTRSILEQEQRIRENVRKLCRFPRRVPQDVFVVAERMIRERTLDEEQAAAVHRCLQSDGVAQTQGRAGAGKTHAFTVVAQAMSQCHFDVVGLAPTNVAAGIMRREGYPQAMTLHKFLGQVEKGKRKLTSTDVLIVDEAAMVDMEIYDRLTTVAAKAGCFLFLIGDDRQLQPVGRGGAYAMIRRELGAAELKNIRRQRTEWMREASRKLSEWDIGPAIKAYDEHGHVTWASSQTSAKRQLVEDWRDAMAANPAHHPFVYAGTRVAVAELNTRLQAVRPMSSSLTAAPTFKTDAGEIRLRVDERIQFSVNDPEKGLFNGILATVTGIDDQRIHVRCDDGTETFFDANEFTGWGLGYAGTCYRGQGRTQDQVFLYYDHPFVWNANTTYVGLTRHRDRVQLYVPKDLAADQATLVRQMSRTMEPLLASDLVLADPAQTKKDIVGEFYPVEPAVHAPMRRKDGKRDVLDVAVEACRVEAKAHFETAEADEFVSDYCALQALAASPPADGPKPGRAEKLCEEIAGIAKRRGFLPDTGNFDPACLDIDYGKREPGILNEDRRLAGRRNRDIDLRSIAFEPDLVPYSMWMKAARRLRQLDASVLDAVLDRINAVRSAAHFDETMSGVLGLAGYLVKISKAIAHGSKDRSSVRLRRTIREEEATPRLVWQPFRLWKTDPVDGLVRMSFGRADGPAEQQSSKARPTPEPRLRDRRDTSGPSLGS